MNLYATVIASYTYIGSVDFYEVQPLLTAQQRLYNKSFSPHNHVYMFTVIGFMLTGITVGYLFRNIAFLQKTEKTISITIFLLLFLLGISVGSNELIINNLAAFGWQAAILAFSATCGSILASWMVLKFFFKKGGEQ